MIRRTWLVASSVLVLSACASMGGTTSQDIVATAQSNKNFTTLTKLVNDAGLAETLKGAGPYTLFAPTDEAFKKLPAKAMAELAGNKDQLRAVLTYHVLPGKVEVKDVKAGKIKTVNGADLTVQKTGDFLTLGEEALVTTPNITASNGVIHAIDRVLVPPPVKK